jgi:hypothetical protein
MFSGVTTAIVVSKGAVFAMRLVDIPGDLSQNDAVEWSSIHYQGSVANNATPAMEMPNPIRFVKLPARHVYP